MNSEIEVIEIDENEDIENVALEVLLKGDSPDRGEDYWTEEDKQEILNDVMSNIQPCINEIEDTAETAVSIAKGANQSLVYGDYQTMITALNAIDKETYKVGQNILIITLNVPDLWISEIVEESAEYAYTNDDDFISLLKEQGYVQVGYYKLSALETQKVELTDYVKNTDYATSLKAGVLKASTTFGVNVATNGFIAIICATTNEIDEKTNIYKPITPSNLDYAVKSVVGGHVTLTQAEYDALVEEGTVNENTFYYIKEE